MTAKTPLTRGKPSDASQAMWPRGNMKQSTFGKRPGWTHLQQAYDILAAQVRMNQQMIINKRIMD
jgi:hypothetical protein